VSAARKSVLVLLENIPVRDDHRVWPECVALRDDGYDVVVISPRRHGSRTTVEVIDGIEVHSFPLVPAEVGALGYLKEYGLAFWRVARLARRLGRKRRFDIVHACNPPDFLLVAAWPLKRRGARFVFDQHDLAPELYHSRFGKRGLLYRATVALERLTFRLADVVLSTNDSYRAVALDRGGKRPEDVFVVRNGPDLRRFLPNPDPSLKRGKPNLIAYVGEMGHQDGVDHALRALALVAQRRNDWHVIFAGDGPALASARELARELGLDDRVEFAGFVSDQMVMKIVSTADLCLAPEPKNAFNDASTMIKVAEYMALGRPLVAYDLTETKVTAGDAALYATDNEVQNFADCITRLLDDPDLRERMGAIGRARVEEALSWEQSERALLAAYAHALSRMDSGAPAR
jgi:glycosyltransferase involved in cell wall biosynthesis